MSLTASIPLEMCPTWLFCIDQWDQLYTSSELEIDPADYPGLVGARFEVVLDATWGEIDQRIRLVDIDLNIYAEITFPWESYRPGTFGDSHTRKSVGFTLAPVKKKYYIQIVCEDVENYGTLDDFRTARVWIDVVDSERIRIQIPLLEGDQSSGGGLDSPEENDQWAYFVSINDYKNQFYERPIHDSWGYGGWDGDEPLWWNVFLLEKAKWQTIDHWTFEVIGSQMDTYVGPSEDPYDPPLGGPLFDPGLLEIAIFNKTKNVMVADTLLAFTEYMPTRKTVDFSNSAINWDDGDEFEIRARCPYTGEGEFLYYSTNGALYRCALYCTLDPANKAQVYLKTGATWSSYDPTGRLLYDPSKYAVGTIAYFESTLGKWDDATYMTRVRSAEITSLLASMHRYTVRAALVGGVYCVYLEEGLYYDTGNYTWYRWPTVATVISNGNLFDPVPGSNVPLGNIGWLDKDGILEDDNVLATIQLNVANDTAILELSGFRFQDVVPVDLLIQGISLTGIFACIGPPQWVDDFVPTMGSGTPLNAWVDAVAYVGGVIQGTWHVAKCNNWYLLNPSWPHFDVLFPQNAYTQPAPVFWPLSGGGTFSFISDRAWTVADLADGTFTIRVRVRVPSSARFTQYEFCWTRATVSGGVDIISVCTPVPSRTTHSESFIILEVEGNETPEKECIFSFPSPN